MSRKRKPTQVQVGTFVVPLARMPELVTKYVGALETEESDNWCRCEWIIHPDDVKVKYGTCRECSHPREHAIHASEREPHYDHPYRGVRRRRSDTAPDCPVHTKEGLILYFLQWAMDHAD